MTDHELLHQFVTQNSQPAFRQLVERHTNWLYSVCLRRLRDSSLAEDAAQAVFLALAQKAPSLLHEPTLSPWLHQAAKFVAANILRARTRRTRHESEAAAMNPNQSPSSPPAQWRELEADLEPALDRLPTADRTMILLRFYEQKSHPEIAALLRISEAAAAKRVERALSRLRSLLTPKSAGASAPFSSAAITSLLLSHTVTPAPLPLVATLSSAATLPITSLTKGALMAMTFAKLQTAAIIIAAACLIIAIPATIVALHHDASITPPPASPLTVAPASAPDDFLAYYSLQPGEALKLVTDAPLEARTAFLADGDPGRAPPPAGKYITIRWDKNRPYLWGYGDTASLNDVLEVYMNIYPQTLNFHVPLPPNAPAEFITLDHSVALPKLKGDLLLRADATPEQYGASLQSLLTQFLGHPVIVSFRDVAQKAIVLRGDWQYTPNQPHAKPEVRGLLDLEIYGPHTDKNMDQGIIANGNRDYFAGHLGEWIQQPVVIDCDDFPSAVSVHFNTENVNDPLSHDKTLILNHLTAQTNLTWSEEIRTIRRLFIESGPPDDVKRVYGLLDNQAFALVTDAPRELRNTFFAANRPDYPNYAPKSITVIWDGDTPRISAFSDTGTVPLDYILEEFTKTYPQQIDCRLDLPPKASLFWNRDRAYTLPRIKGDFVIRANATPGQYCSSLRQILSEAIHQPVAVTFRDVEQTTIILRGRWQFTPDPQSPNPHLLNNPTLEIYGPRLDNKSADTSTCDRDSFAGRLGEWLHQPVINEATDFPNAVTTNIHTLADTPDAPHAHDKIPILQHLAEQTGLTWTEEPRTIRRLFIEAAPAP